MNKIDTIIARWTNPESRPLFKGKLIDEEGCCCAQGDILRNECGISYKELRNTDQGDADKEVARFLDIPLFQSILLRTVNDSADGCPQDVLSNIEKFLGPHHQKALLFIEHVVNKTWTYEEENRICKLPFNIIYGHHLRNLNATKSEKHAFIYAANSSIEEMVGGYNGRFASYALTEIIAFDELQEKGIPPYFLPLLGINSLDEIPS